MRADLSMFQDMVDRQRATLRRDTQDRAPNGQFGSGSGGQASPHAERAYNHHADKAAQKSREAEHQGSVARIASHKPDPEDSRSVADYHGHAEDAHTAAAEQHRNAAAMANSPEDKKYHLREAAHHEREAAVHREVANGGSL